MIINPLRVFVLGTLIAVVVLLVKEHKAANAATVSAQH